MVRPAGVVNQFSVRYGGIYVGCRDPPRPFAAHFMAANRATSAIPTMSHEAELSPRVLACSDQRAEASTVYQVDGGRRW